MSRKPSEDALLSAGRAVVAELTAHRIALVSSPHGLALRTQRNTAIPDAIMAKVRSHRPALALWMQRNHPADWGFQEEPEHTLLVQRALLEFGDIHGERWRADL